jgi:four helix bundle protein
MTLRKPEGYRDLLAYQKAHILQEQTLTLVALFPKTKTYIDLADQMARSARSTTKNIVEGWKRNTTKEYITFLGYSIGSNSEMMEDTADIVTGLYKELNEKKGIMGEMGGGMGSESTDNDVANNTVSRERLDKLLFYPLSPHYSPIIQLFLRAKEVNFLLARLQKSLDIKMDEEKMRPMGERYQKIFMKQEREESAEGKIVEEYMKAQGLVRLADGRVVKQEEHEG